MKDLNYFLNLNCEIKIRKLTSEEGGGWFAEIPLLPGCISDGETPEEAIFNINEAKKCWVETSLLMKGQQYYGRNCAGLLKKILQM